MLAASGEKDVLYELNIKTKTMKKFEKGHELSKQLLSSVQVFKMKNRLVTYQRSEEKNKVFNVSVFN